MLKTLILICLVGTARADCTEDSADAVILGPDAVSLVECGMHGQAYVAGGALAGYLDHEHYLKVSCTAGRRGRAPALQPIGNAAQVRAGE